MQPNKWTVFKHCGPQCLVNSWWSWEALGFKHAISYMPSTLPMLFLLFLALTFDSQDTDVPYKWPSPGVREHHPLHMWLVSNHVGKKCHCRHIPFCSHHCHPLGVQCIGTGPGMCQLLLTLRLAVCYYSLTSSHTTWRRNTVSSLPGWGPERPK